MSNSSNSSLPSDVCLLLRADAEQCWLHREVIPVLRQVESGEQLAAEEARAALAYLEAMWGEARVRARHTDAAADSHLESGERNSSLSTHAGRYHASVCVLREIVAARIAPLVNLDAEDEQSPCGARTAQLLAQAPDAGGCAPRAA